MARFRQQVLALKVQGATAVARETLSAVAEYAASLDPKRSLAWTELRRTAKALATVRPTEPMARNLAHWFVVSLGQAWQRGSGRDSWDTLVAQSYQELEHQLKVVESRIAAIGSRLVKRGQTIFTHCHSSLAERILVAARAAGKSFVVYHTETRPLFQGHITDRHLRARRIKTIIVADSAAAYLVSNHSGDDVAVDWVLLGADSVGRDGSVINKIGSFGIALAAYDSKIPVYIATPLLKLDWQAETKIELRHGRELWPGAPRGAQIVNYAFDRIPAKYISGLITEFGLVKPAAVTALARRHYPWLARAK